MLALIWFQTNLEKLLKLHHYNVKSILKLYQSKTILTDGKTIWSKAENIV